MCSALYFGNNLSGRTQGVPAEGYSTQTKTYHTGVAGLRFPGNSAATPGYSLHRFPEAYT